MPDWEMWFAWKDGIPADTPGWTDLPVDIPVARLRQLRAATHLVGERYGVRRVGEFMELVLWEYLESKEWTFPYEFVLSQTGEQPCFFCGTPTEIIDISFEAPFCNSAVCNWAIDEDLRMSSVRLQTRSEAERQAPEAPRDLTVAF